MATLLQLFKKAESYGGGSTSGDFLGTEDGSETSQRDIDTYEASNGDGQGRTPAGGHANHPVTPLGEQGHEKKQTMPGMSPFNEADVDDNHANNEGGISAKHTLLDLFTKTASDTAAAAEPNPYENFPLMGHEPDAMGVSGKRRPFNIPNLINHGLVKLTKTPDQDQPNYKPGNVSLVTHYNQMHAGPNDFTNTLPHIKNLPPPVVRNLLDSNKLDNYKYHQILWGMHDKKIPEHEIFTDVPSPYNKPEDRPGAKSAGLLGLLQHADEKNFFLQNSTDGGVADSPETMDDGHPFEELVEQEGVDSTINSNPHPSNAPDPSIIRDRSVVDKSQAQKDRINTTPDINKGRNVASGLYPFITSLGPQVKRARQHPDTDYKNESNVSDVMYSQEAAAKADRVHKDFGMGDQMNDGITMDVAPLSGDGQSEEEKNYSGRENSTAGLLRFFTKHADYAGVMPSANPNSGRDTDANDINRNVMTDGKGDFNNVDDKKMMDPVRYRKQMQYNRNKVEDNGAEHYYNTLNSGGGFGMEGDPTKGQSGVNNA
jgi:hypothetical protein